MTRDHRGAPVRYPSTPIGPRETRSPRMDAASDRLSAGASFRKVRQGQALPGCRCAGCAG